MKSIFEKVIKKDREADELYLFAKICNENKITIEGSNQKDTITIDVSYNQLLSIVKFCHNVIDEYYQEYESSAASEKTQEIYIDDDPVNW
jgi:hypothetical protein